MTSGSGPKQRNARKSKKRRKRAETHATSLGSRPLTERERREILGR